MSFLDSVHNTQAIEAAKSEILSFLAKNARDIMSTHHSHVCHAFNSSRDILHGRDDPAFRRVFPEAETARADVMELHSPHQPPQIQ